MSTSTEKFFTTPDYKVKLFSSFSEFSQYQKDPSKVKFREDELQETYEKFTAFKALLNETGYLPEDLVTFTQHKPGTRSIMYRLPAFVDLFVDLTNMNPQKYIPGNMPDLHMFQAHLQRSAIFGMATSSFIRLFPEVFEGFADEAKTKFGVSVFKNDAIDYSVAGDYFLTLMDRLGEVLKRENIEDTQANRIKLWATTSFVWGGNSVTGRNTLNTAAAQTAFEYLFGMMRLGLPLYHMFLFLSSSVNSEFNNTKKMTFPLDELQGFVDVPRTYLTHLVLDPDAKQSNWRYQYSYFV